MINAIASNKEGIYAQEAYSLNRQETKAHWQVGKVGRHEAVRWQHYLCPTGYPVKRESERERAIKLLLA